MSLKDLYTSATGTSSLSEKIWTYCKEKSIEHFENRQAQRESGNMKAAKFYDALVLMSDQLAWELPVLIEDFEALGPSANLSDLADQIRTTCQNKKSEYAQARRSRFNAGDRLAASFYEGMMKMADQMSCDLPRMIEEFGAEEPIAKQA